MTGTTTKYPVVFIHGLLGYGKKRPLWGLGPYYWPEAVLTALNPNHIIVDVGTASSDHDRACEAFYQIYGGTVDYGLQHSRENQHSRYGSTYLPPLHPQWSATHPIHLVGHSLGSTTALELYQLVCDDYFQIGTSSTWICSITSIAGPLTGTTLIHVAGVFSTSLQPWAPLHTFHSLCALLMKLYTSYFPCLRGFYDLKMDQWDHLSLSDLIHVQGTLLQSLDLSMFTGQPAARVLRNSQLKYMNKLYLLSITTSGRVFPFAKIELGIACICFLLWKIRFPPFKGQKTHLQRLVLLVMVVLCYRRLRQVDYATTTPVLTLSGLMQRCARAVPTLFEGYDHDQWAHNDGVVNIHSMLRPFFPSPSKEESRLVRRASQSSLALAINRCASHISIDQFAHEEEEKGEEKMIKGRWYVYRVDRNHFAGTYGDKEAHDLYKSLFLLMIHQYEKKQDKDQESMATIAA